ncbi:MULTISPECIES: hypothetical protein [unclassified Gemella]|nr:MULTISPECIES: hypothetical protein [unclassified Gemella]
MIVVTVKNSDLSKLAIDNLNKFFTKLFNNKPELIEQLQKETKDETTQRN